MVARIAGIRLALEGGADLTDTANPRLVELALTEKRGGEADTLELTLQNADGALETPEAGRILSLAIGWKQSDGSVPVGLVDKGRFKVDEVELAGPPDTVTIRARSADLTGAYTRRRTASWKKIVLGTLLREIASRNGSEARVHASLAGRLIDAIEQHGKSDMAFVMDLGRRYDALATWKDKLLLFIPIGEASTASGTALATATLARTDTSGEWRFAYAQRDEHDGAEAEWHDADAGRRRKIRTGGSNPKRLKRTYATEGEAEQAARSEASRRQRGAYTFECTPTLADCARQPNTRVTLSGWNSKIDGTAWLIESIETKLSKDGLSQALMLESV